MEHGLETGLVEAMGATGAALASTAIGAHFGASLTRGEKLDSSKSRCEETFLTVVRAGSSMRAVQRGKDRVDNLQIGSQQCPYTSPSGRWLPALLDPLRRRRRGTPQVLIPRCAGVQRLCPRQQQRR